MHPFDEADVNDIREWLAGNLPQPLSPESDLFAGLDWLHSKFPDVLRVLMALIDIAIKRGDRKALVPLCHTYLFVFDEMKRPGEDK